MFAANTPGFLKPIAKIFEPLVKLLHWVLVNLHSAIANLGVKGAAWGLAIIVLTIIVRLIIMPLTFKQFRSARAMAALQPHIDNMTAVVQALRAAQLKTWLASYESVLARLHTAAGDRQT